METDTKATIFYLVENCHHVFHGNDFFYEGLVNQLLTSIFGRSWLWERVLIGITVTSSSGVNMGLILLEKINILQLTRIICENLSLIELHLHIYYNPKVKDY